MINELTKWTILFAVIPTVQNGWQQHIYAFAAYCRAPAIKVMCSSYNEPANVKGGQICALGSAYLTNPLISAIFQQQPVISDSSASPINTGSVKKNQRNNKMQKKVF